MVQRRIVTLIGSIALTVLGVGYAARTTSAGSSPADAAASPSAKASELSGTWRGSFNIVGGDADRQGDVALDIKDDATYKMTWTRKGTTSNESGRVVTNGRRVSLQSSSGQMSLVRSGDTLYGMSSHLAGGHPVHVTVQRATGSGPDSQASALPRFDPDVEESSSAPASNPLQAP